MRPAEKKLEWLRKEGEKVNTDLGSAIAYMPNHPLPSMAVEAPKKGNAPAK